MKYLKFTILKILILGIVFSFSLETGGQLKASEKFVEMRISTPKREYLLGEPVVIDRLIEKRGSGRVLLGDTQEGLIILIAAGQKEFRRYKFNGHNPNAYRLQGERRHAVDFIFFNSKPVTYHLSEYGRREVEEGMILTDYAFSEPGQYRIKAHLTFTRVSESRPTWEIMESNEISISLKEPEGDDRQIWELMKADSRIGHFMTEGEAPYRFPSIQDEVLAEVDRIVGEYPTSYLAGLLKEKAAENRARQARREQENERRRLHREFDKAISTPKKN